MKVLDVLKKVGLITTSSDEEPGSIAGSRADSSGGAPGRAGVRNRLEKEQAHGHSVPPPPDESSLAPLGATELVVDFEKIFAALEIPVPPHGWTVEKLARALDSAHFQPLDDATRKAALLAMLEASAAPVAEVVDDAIRRDQGLDAYERFARRKLGERLAGIQETIAKEEARIQEAQKAIQDMRESVAKAEAEFRTWLDRKVAKEQELARVVALLTTESVISIGDTGEEPESGQARGGADSNDKEE